MGRGHYCNCTFPVFTQYVTMLTWDVYIMVTKRDCVQQSHYCLLVDWQNVMIIVVKTEWVYRPWKCTDTLTLKFLFRSVRSANFRTFGIYKYWSLKSWDTLLQSLEMNHLPASSTPLPHLCLTTTTRQLYTFPFLHRMLKFEFQWTHNTSSLQLIVTDTTTLFYT